METLLVVIKVNETATAQFENLVVPALINVWMRFPEGSPPHF